MIVSKLMNSGYARVADDNYQTIDPRCVYAFLEHFRVPTIKYAVDPCAPSGSGIVDTLKELGVNAFGIGDAFAKFVSEDWIVSNPPYKRGLVDKIIWRQIERLRLGEANGVAMLMRWTFDFAKFRQPMFQDNPLYVGKIQMLFRPQWFEKRPGDSQGFHPFVWHIWHKKGRIGKYPIVLYSKGEKPCQNPTFPLMS